MPTFYEGFRETAERWPNNVAVEIQRRDSLDRLESYTYRELLRMGESVGRWLVEQKLEHGARIALIADNSPRWVATFLGIIAAGCTAVPLDTTLDHTQAAKLLKDSGSSWFFADSKHLAVAEEAACAVGIGVVQLDGESTSKPTLDQILSAGPADFVSPSSSPEEVACILYTSGTTADPKGVMLSHANFRGEAEAAFGWAHIDSNDAVLGILPLFHVLALVTNLVLPLLMGARVVYLETLNAREMLRGLEERRITVLSVVPAVFYLIHERIFSEVAARGKLVQLVVRILMALSLFMRRFGVNPGKLFFPKVHKVFGGHMRYLLSAGSRFSSPIARDFRAFGLDVMQGYGLTETTGAAFATPPDRIVIGSVGPPLQGLEGKIANPQVEEGIDTPVGEILIRGASVMKGYWNRPDATREVLKDGWLYTGDLGYFDARGNLFVTGRKKEVIVLSTGKNIYPEEVEAHYQKSECIKEICVLGLEDASGAERLHAVVVPDFDVLKRRKVVNVREVVRFELEGLSAELPSTKRINSYEIWQENLPRTTTRKIKRFEVQHSVEAAQAKGSAETEFDSERALSAEELSWLDEPGVQKSLAVIRNMSTARRGGIRPDANLELDLGFDSMQRIELVMALEQELGASVEQTRLAEVYTVRQLVDLVRESTSAEAARADVDQGSAWHVLLHEAPVDPSVAVIVRRRPAREAFLYVVVRILSVVVHRLFRLRVVGLENIPREGPIIVCPNHQSVIDAVILGTVMPWPIFRRLVLLGTSEFFENRFLALLIPRLRIIVVDPDANLVPAMRAGAFALKENGVLIIYPEGERSIDGKPKKFKRGSAILSIHMSAPIVPVAIDGFHDAWPRGKPFQGFKPLQIQFGAPVYPPPESEASTEAYERLTAEVRQRVVQMWEELRPRSARRGHPPENGSGTE
jgi:long-chain acyl-CoA synthetase